MNSMWYYSVKLCSSELLINQYKALKTVKDLHLADTLHGNELKKRCNQQRTFEILQTW